MINVRFWQRLFNVYPDEWWIAKRLYLLLFFQGAGTAFFFTSAFARFLQKFPITDLSWVLIFSSILLWITGFVYTRLEHALPFRLFNVVVILFMAGSIFLLRMAGYFSLGNWYEYLVLAWFNVLYLLNNLEFWGLAATHFDLRQSKRLFAVISAGDIPAKVLGYSMAWIIVPFTGTQNLLYIGSGCMLASLIFFNGMVKSVKLLSQHHYKKQPQKHTPKHISKLVSDFTTNIFIRRIAFISLITSSCIILINYGFYSEVRKAYEGDVALAKFIAFFFAILRIVAMITKMVIASRLTESIGIRLALFITPVGMLGLILIIVGVNYFEPGEKLVLYMFGTVFILVDVLRTSFNTPVLLSLMQPLGTFERLRAHNIVKGIMDPFASLFCGLFLLIAFNIEDRVNLMTICYLLLLLGVFWMIGIVLVNRRYVMMLIQTISTRYFTKEEFSLNDNAILDEIKVKMKTASDMELISILRMLTSKMDTQSEELIIPLLKHPSEQVQLESVRLIRTHYILPGKDILRSLLNEKGSDEWKYEIIKTICAITDDDKEVSLYLENPWQPIHTAALTGMLYNKSPAIRELGHRAVGNLLTRTAETDKLSVLSLLKEVRNEYDHPQHARLIEDTIAETRQRAIQAAGKACCPETLKAIWNNINENEKLVLDTLYEVGYTAIPLIEEQLMCETNPFSLKEKLIQLCGKIGGYESIEILVGWMQKKPMFFSPAIRALHRCKFTAPDELKPFLENMARQYISNGVELLYMQKALAVQDSHFNILNNSLRYELEDIRELLLCLFGCLYDRKKINQVKFALMRKEQDGIANAMEIIELTVKKDIGKHFSRMFETGNVDQRCLTLHSLFKERSFNNPEQVMTRILSGQPIHFMDWTKACALYLSRGVSHLKDLSLIKKFMNSESRLLRETAVYASAIP